MNKLFIGLITFIFVGCIVIALFTRNSFADDVTWDLNKEDFYSYEVSGVSSNDMMTRLYYDANSSSFDSVKEHSSLIVEVKATSDRKNTNSSMLTTVHVLDVLKGVDVKKGDTLYIFEPASFRNHSYKSENGYILMKDQEDYILCLHPLVKPKGYTYKNNESSSYMLTSTIYGKFSASDKQSAYYVINDDRSEKLAFAQVAEYDLLVSNQADGKLYKQIRNELFEWISKAPY